MKKTLLLVLVCALGLSDCAHHTSTQAPPKVAQIDVEHLITLWPVGVKGFRDIAIARKAIETNTQGLSSRDRAEAAQRLLLRAARLQEDLARRIRIATQAVATHDGISLVVTRDMVGYGGKDITNEVLTELNRSLPGPSGSKGDS